MQKKNGGYWIAQCLGEWPILLGVPRDCGVLLRMFVDEACVLNRAESLPALLVFFPRYWGNIIELFNQTQHIGLPEDIKDHRYTTRSVRFNPIFSFLYWHMEYHVEHHMFPSVPSYNLPKLSNLIKDQLPKANTSLYDAYKEILPAIVKQHKDNSYHILKEVPSSS